MSQGTQPTAHSPALPQGQLPVPVICLAGPTGSGKTAAALALAQALGGEVINADSRQVYADFPIITAQPLPEERALCPHHLYGFLPTQEKIAAGVWAEQAVAQAKQVLARGHIPLIVGGTGLYFKTLLHGLAEIPPIDAALTAALTQQCALRGSAALHQDLQSIDPAYAAKIHPNDRQRIVRALEVAQGTGRSFSWWHEHAAQEPLCTGALFGLAITLEGLSPRLDARIDAMMAAGALQEAQQAFALCPQGSAPGWSGIGCAELYAHLRGRLSWQEARSLWMHNTRAYAKRQLTWFKAQPELVWFAPNDAKGLLQAAKKAIKTFFV
ncbi:MAG: tRNA (adenosine(37)-N6)-dimethylallyltransferase MiaA [Desulfovibrionaceae bacterium]|nr:tRNA (adenosine(37)-N6)-dimethylallyltransferase MiaA [Desulfovibrionaceae bacterium]